MHKKLTEIDIEAVKLAHYMLFNTKILRPPLKPNKNMFKNIDFCKFMGEVYGVHWKTIERILRK